MRFLPLALLLHAVSSAAGAVYTWTDAHGVVHYSDRPVGSADATTVPGMQVGPAPAAAPPALDAAALQGTWCEYELRSVRAGSEVIAERIEWVFDGDTLRYSDLDAGLDLHSSFRIEESRIVTDQVAMGNHTVRRYDGEQLELGTDAAHSRLRRGGC